MAYPALIESLEHPPAEVINLFKLNHSIDVYGLNMNLIKSIKDVLITPLTKIINRCIHNHIFSDSLKLASVIPVHKKGTYTIRTTIDQYQYFQSYLKSIKTILLKQLLSHFESHNLLCPSQFGFRYGISTTNAILEQIL